MLKYEWIIINFIININFLFMKILMFTKNTLSKFTSAITMIALILVTSFGPNLAIAASFTASKDTATRLKISTNADHVITFTMPTAITFDTSTNQDGFQFDFPASFVSSGTWANADFTFVDSTGSRTIEGTTQGAGTITCTSATAENVCVAFDTTNNIFTVKPSAGTFTTTSAASAVTFTILGTGAGGTLLNPASVAATNIDFKMCDEQPGCFTTFVGTHSSQIAYAIADDDQVTVTAIVGSSITFDIDTETGGTTGESSAPYNVALGTITTVDTRVSGTTDAVQLIVLEGDTSGAGGMVVTVQNANGGSGLVSTSAGGDNIGSADGTIADGTENYGLCVATAGLTAFSRASPYNTDTCATNSETNGVQLLTTAGENILNSGGAPFTGGHAEVVVNAAISTATVAHNDYTDTLTFIATGTF
ncbi:MAG: hypothetical protein AAB477_01530 [Patescibacteria group bacterium]